MAPLIGRRELLRRALHGSAVWTALAAEVRANPLGLPVGLELISVLDDLREDFDGTLRQVGAIGYREIEPYTMDQAFRNSKPAKLRASLDAAGLTCVDLRYVANELETGLDEKIARALEFGCQYLVCAMPWIPDASRVPGAMNAATFSAIWRGMTLDDWKWNADLFNRAGERCGKSGIQFAYHNHNFDFRKYGAVVAYDELLRRTDPKLVKMELDCGWVVRAGLNPATYLRQNAGRIPLLHIKDFQAGFTPSTDQSPARNAPLGQGVTEWRVVFAAARQAGVRHYFVEQENFDLPPLEEVRTSYDYLSRLKV